MTRIRFSPAVAVAFAGAALCVGAHAQETFKLGIVNFLSGQAAESFGNPAVNGAKVLVDAFNEGAAPAPYNKPGFGGMKIEAVYLDENGGATKQVQELRNLSDREKVDAVVGYVGSGDCLAVAPVAEEMKRFLILYDCGTPRIFEDNKLQYMFRTASHAAMDNVALVRYLKSRNVKIENFNHINPGKTTLLRSLMGHLAPGEGSVEFDGRDLLALPAHARAGLGIGYMPEDRGLVPELTVEENILVPLWVNRALVEADRLALVYHVLPEVAEMRARRALLLSGDQQRLVALARALAAGTRLLLLDDPFEGVAPALATRLAEVIASLKGSDVSVLLAQSDLNHARRLVDGEYVIERGANVETAAVAR